MILAIALWWWNEGVCYQAAHVMTYPQRYSAAKVAAAEQLLNQRFDLSLSRLQSEVDALQAVHRHRRPLRSECAVLMHNVKYKLDYPGMVLNQPRRDQANCVMAGIYFEHDDLAGTDRCLLQVRNRELEGYLGLLQRVNLLAHARQTTTTEPS